MSIKQKKKHCYLGHPCGGCPYVFTRGGTDCIMGAVPGECVWYFYLSLLGYHYTQQEKMEIQKRYEQYTHKSKYTEKRLKNTIEMLITVAELKYGKEYAGYLKQKMGGEKT